jgi:hypothetical protein
MRRYLPFVLAILAILATVLLATRSRPKVAVVMGVTREQALQEVIEGVVERPTKRSSRMPADGHVVRYGTPAALARMGITREQMLQVEQHHQQMLDAREAAGKK